jgi:hypothetical protein
MLLTEIADGEGSGLQSEVDKLKRQLKQAKKEKRASDRKLKRHEDSLKRLFNPDQLAAMKRKSTRGMKWETSTVKKALKLRFSCGTTGYTDLLQTGMPLPSIRILQSRLQSIHFSPGILASVLSYLSTKVSKFTFCFDMVSGCSFFILVFST